VVEDVQPGANVVLPAVPGTRENVILEMTLAEGAVEMKTGALRGIELVADPDERQLAVARLDALCRPRRDLFDPGNGDEHALDTSSAPFYASRVATILLAGVDLFFRGKLEAVLPGHRFVTADSVETPDLVICDIARIDPDDVVETYPDVTILGFTNHNDTAGLRRAHTAGFDHVVAKSALEDRVKDLVEELNASVE